jgi:endonuclease/exonuclease/phosphatase family metal-dependent hydrolase
VVTFNVLGCRGFPLKAGGPVAFQKVSPAVLQTLADRIGQWQADVVILQEAPPEPDVREIARRAGLHAAFFPTPAPATSEWPFGFPGAVLSRYPIVEVRDCAAAVREKDDDRFYRHWGSTVIALGDRPLRVQGTHLCADWGGMNREKTRLAELDALLQDSKADVIGADCNTRPGEAPWRRMRDAGWRDSWLEGAGLGAGHTSDARKPHQRIDYLWLSPTTAWRVRSAQVINEGFQVEVGGTAVLLSDHLPVMMELTSE